MPEVTLRCARCEYDLRMIDPAGVCPECALPIETSRTFAREVANTTAYWWRPGARILLASWVARIVFTIVVVIWQAMTGRRSILYSRFGLLNPWPIDELVPMVDRIFQSGFALFVRFLLAWWMAIEVAQCVGLWMFTEPMPRRDEWQWPRWTARCAPLATVLVYACARYAGSGSMYDGSVEWTIAMLVVTWLPSALLLLWSVRVGVTLRAPAHIRWLGIGAAVGALIFAIEDVFGGRLIAAILPAAAVAYGVTLAMGWMWFVLLRQMRGAKVPT